MKSTISRCISLFVLLPGVVDSYLVYHALPKVSDLFLMKEIRRRTVTRWSSAGDTHGESSIASGGIAGDRLREATGIRPSLHPVTINAIARALRERARPPREGEDDDLPLRVTETVPALRVAMSAGKIAADAVRDRKETSDRDGMELTAEEEQTVVGRVVGVVMRLDDLERRLAERCRAAGWVSKYGEWDSFGVLANEGEGIDDEEGDGSSPAPTSDTSLCEGGRMMVVDHRCLKDPLFRMNRAECLLALFLHSVEEPDLKKIGKTVPGGSEVDFLDTDRREVLLK